MSTIKKVLLVVLACVVCLSLVACKKSDENKTDDKKNNTTTAPTNTPEPTKGGETTPEPTDVPVEKNDFGGASVILADWWSPENWKDPTNSIDEAFWDWQNQLMADNNYTFDRKKCYEWGEVQETATLSITTNEPVGDIIVLDSGWVASLLDKDMFRDVSNMKYFNWDDAKWNQGVKDVMTIGKGIYGFAAGLEPRTGIFFNKDLFKKILGEDKANYPYELQANGQWNWDNFKNLCKDLTKDLDGDGTPDVYGIASFSNDFFTACLLANATNVVVKNENGELVMNANDSAVLDALNWGRSLYDEGYHMPRPEGDDVQWNWFVQMFQEQRTAMRCCEEYNVSDFCAKNDDGIAAYPFEYGFVTFPYGPKAGKLLSIDRENVLIIPNCDAVKDKLDVISFAYNNYTDKCQEQLDDPNAWKASYEAQFMDKESMDTLDLMINKLDQVMNCTILLPDFVWDWVWDIDSGVATPKEQIDTFSGQWQTYVDEFNAKLK